MSIDANTGLPGSGKSFSAVMYRIIPALRVGRTVVTNLPLNLSEIEKRFPGAKVIPIDLDRFSIKLPDSQRASLCDEMPPGALIVLDELWRLWPSGLKANNIPQDHKTFLAEHRHRVGVGADQRETDILFITQDLGQLAAFARQLVDKTAITTKLDAVGLNSRARVDIYQGAITGQTGPKGQLVRTMTIKYSREVFALYQSHTASQTGEAGTNHRDDKRAVVWRSPMFVAGAVLVFVGVPWSVLTAVDTLTSLGRPEPVELTPAPVYPAGYAAAHAATPAPEPTPTPEPEPQFSESWRMSGFVQRVKDGTGFALLHKNGSVVRLDLHACDPIPNSPDIQCLHEGELVNVATGYGGLSARSYIGGGR